MLNHNTTQKIINFNCLFEMQHSYDADLPITEEYVPVISEHHTQSLMMNQYAVDILYNQHGINDELIEHYQIGLYHHPESQRDCITIPLYQNSDLVGFYYKTVSNFDANVNSWGCGHAPRIYNLDNCCHGKVIYLFDDPLKAISMAPVLHGHILAVATGFMLSSLEVTSIMKKSPSQLIVCCEFSTPEFTKFRIISQFKPNGIEVLFETDIEDVTYGKA